MKASKAIAALCAAPALLLAGCSLFNDETPVPFEISRVVLPKDIPPPADESKAYRKPETPAPADATAKPEAIEAQESMHARSASLAKPQDLVKMKAPSSEAGAFLTSKSFVTRWNILGPLQADACGGDADGVSSPLQKEYVQSESALDGSRSAPEGAAWNVKVFSNPNPPGVVDVGGVFQGVLLNDKAFYATACLDCPEDVENASLLFASDGPVKIWLNGVLVHAYDKGPREMKLDQDSIDSIYLKKGYNRIVVKYVEPQGATQPAKFMLRFATREGAPISTEP